MSNLETVEHTSPPSPVFVIKGNTLVQCLDHNSASLVVPEGVEEIVAGAFAGCKSLVSLTLPSTLEFIGGWVFSQCTSLQEIHLPKELKSVKAFAFSSCDSLKRLYKEPSDTPCQWELITFPTISQFDFLDRPILAELGVRQQYDYCLNHWEGAQQEELTQFLFSQPNLVDFALSQDSLPLISYLLHTMAPLSLLPLGDYINISIQRKSTEITATFLEYRHKHYSPQEVEAYYSRQEMIDCGFVLPTMEEFSRRWHYEIVDEGDYVAQVKIGTVKIIGYRGQGTEEVIPKVLADGKVIGSFVHGNEKVFSHGLTHLRIDADLWNFDCSYTMADLQSLEITGTMLRYMNCRDLPNLTSCTYVGKGHKDLIFTFQNCDLHRFTVPDGVTRLLGNCFRNCKNLQTLTIPPSVVDIGEDAFLDYGNLTVYGKIGSEAESYCKEQGIPFVEMTEENP